MKLNNSTLKLCFDNALGGQVDFQFPDDPVWSSNMKKNFNLHYSDPIVSYTNGISVLKKNQYKGIENLRRLGTMIGFTPVGYEKRIKLKKIDLNENADLNGLIKQLIIGRVDGVFLSRKVVQYQIDKMGIKGVAVFDETLPFNKRSWQNELPQRSMKQLHSR